jgi:hypothetical protein
MSDDDSLAQRDAWARRSLPRDVKAWVRSLPLRSLVRSPATFDVSLQILAVTPAPVTKRIASMNRRANARGEIARVRAASAAPVPSLYCSAGMPGPFLELPAPPLSGLGSEAERSRELREWCATWSLPRPWDPATAADRDLASRA